jgi:hypothetical protein
LLRSPFDASVQALEPILGGARPVRGSALLMISVVASWYLYVPIHELLHALGCAATGGTVTTLQIQTQYGGELLAGVFSFVEPGGDYAGRLSDFDTHGSDFVYLATDALPFALSILVGVPLLRRAARTGSPLLAGPGFVLGLAPFYNIPGDYFEMASILTTAALGKSWQVLRSDDVLRLVSQLVNEPVALGFVDGLEPGAVAVVAASLLLAIALAYGSWWLGDLLAGRFS